MTGIKELIVILLQIAAFLGFSFLLLNDVGKSIGLGYILYLFWTKLDSIAKNHNEKEFNNRENSKDDSTATV